MRFHGLVSLAVLGLTSRGFAQENLLPVPQHGLPAVKQPVMRPGDSVPPEPASPDPATSIEAELQQFRNELREFHELQEEIARSTRETDIDSDRVSLQQRKDLLELLTRLAKKGVGRKSGAVKSNPTELPIQTPPAMPPEPVANLPVPMDVEITDDVADPFALGKVLFRSGDFVNAERAFRKVDVTSDNAPTLNYLIATCLRRQSKWQSATEIYKAVSESDRDPVLRDLARWQIDNIRWHRESEAQLEQMRIEREKRLGTGKPPQAKAGTVNKKIR